MSFPQTLKQANLQDEGKTLPPLWRWNRILPFLVLLHRLVQNLNHKAPHQSQCPSVHMLSVLFLSVSFIPWGGGGALSSMAASHVPSREHPKRCSHRLLHWNGKESYRKQENRGVLGLPPNPGTGNTNSSLSHFPYCNSSQPCCNRAFSPAPGEAVNALCARMLF